MSSGVRLTSWKLGPSLALVSHPSSDGITIKIPYGVDVSLPSFPIGLVKSESESLDKFVGNKAKGRISTRVLKENKARQFFQKTNISYLLICTRTLKMLSASQIARFEKMPSPNQLAEFSKELYLKKHEVNQLSVVKLNCDLKNF